MKHALSISLGSSARDKRVEVELLGERVINRLIENGSRIGSTKIVWRNLIALSRRSSTGTPPEGAASSRSVRVSRASTGPT